MDTAGATENSMLDRMVLRMTPLAMFSFLAWRAAFTRKWTDWARMNTTTSPDSRYKKGWLTENAIQTSPCEVFTNRFDYTRFSIMRGLGLISLKKAAASITMPPTSCQKVTLSLSSSTDSSTATRGSR